MACVVCTYVNSPGTLQCAVCDESLEPFKTSVLDQGKQYGVEDGWACEACTFRNEPKNLLCTMCNTSRAAIKKLKPAKVHPSAFWLSVGLEVIVGQRVGTLAVDNQDGTWDVLFDDDTEEIVAESAMDVAPSQTPKAPPSTVNELVAQRLKFENDKSEEKTEVQTESSFLKNLPENFSGRCSVSLKRLHLTLDFMTSNIFGALDTGGALWPAEVLLAEIVAAFFKPTIDSRVRPRVLELGCGSCPAAGLTAQALGYDVVLTDVPHVLAAAQQNAVMNRAAIEKASAGVGAGILDGDKLFWGEAIPDVVKMWRPYDLILSADCIFREEFHRPLALTFATLLSTNSNVLWSSSSSSSSSGISVVDSVNIKFSDNEMKTRGVHVSETEKKMLDMSEIKAGTDVGVIEPRAVEPVILLAYQHRQATDDRFVSEILPSFGLKARPMHLEEGFVACSAAMNWSNQPEKSEESSFKVFFVTKADSEKLLSLKTQQDI